MKHINPYLRAKAINNANTLMKSFSMDRAKAIKMTTRLWDEARAMILRNCSVEEWQKLSIADKGRICGEAIKALMDRKRVTAFLNGERKTLN